MSLSMSLSPNMRLTKPHYRQRKELMHQKLMVEVIQQLSSRFKPDVTMVKKRIESLIEREYLERTDDTSTSAYRYLA
jgi:cullin 3